MLKNDGFFTSESVSEGHPDKVADQISDYILDYILARDNTARVAIETLVTTRTVIVAGEVRSSVILTDELLTTLIKHVVKEIGYDQPEFGYQELNVVNLIHEQSSDIAVGVDETANKSEGAGDQGIMFGFACDDTETYMPVPLYYSNMLLLHFSQLRKSQKIDFLLPDSKTQLTVHYKNSKVDAITHIVLSHQHKSAVNLDDLYHFIKQEIKHVLPERLYNPRECIHYINPTGRFVIGGPNGDTGLTGRKIVVDTYGGMVPHGGGAFSGKDPTKVDRSAAYMTRYIAKNIVAAGIAKKCLIQISYAIGITQPLSVYVNTYDTIQLQNIDDLRLAEIIRSVFDLSPKGIRETLNLNQPIYFPTASYGHFGRHSIGSLFSWERLDLIDKLHNYLK